MRYPGYRVPIAGMKFCESPNNPMEGQTIFNVPVLCDIARVVKVNEVILLHLPIDGECRNDE